MPLFKEQRLQIWKCIFVADLSQAQNGCFWLTQMKDSNVVGPTCHCEGAKYGSYIKEMQPETTSLLVIADNNLTYPDLHWRHKIAFFPKPQFPLPPHFHPLLSHSLGYEPR